MLSLVLITRVHFSDQRNKARMSRTTAFYCLWKHHKEVVDPPCISSRKANFTSNKKRHYRGLLQLFELEDLSIDASISSAFSKDVDATNEPERRMLVVSIRSDGWLNATISCWTSCSETALQRWGLTRGIHCQSSDQHQRFPVLGSEETGETRILNPAIRRSLSRCILHGVGHVCRFLQHMKIKKLRVAISRSATLQACRRAMISCSQMTEPQKTAVRHFSKYRRMPQFPAYEFEASNQEAYPTYANQINWWEDRIS